MSDPEHDLFLSYTGADRDAVVEIRSRLEALGVKTFLDRSNLTAGQPWPLELEKALGSCKGVAVFVGARAELGTWQLRESWMALDRQAQAQGRGESFPVVPVLLPGADPRASFLFLNTWVDLRGGVDDAVAIGRLVDAVRRPSEARDQEEAKYPDICPYRGLQPFRRQDEPFFFGREAFSDELTTKVLTHRLVAVIGASGSGKSSVVQAGLLPRLGKDPEARSWETATFRPGELPFHALALALAPLRWPDLDDLAVEAKAKRLGDQLLEGTSRIEVQVEKLLAESNGSTAVLLVVDQFEELFRETPKEQRPPFVDALLAAIDRSHHLRVVLTLRADFYSEALEISRELGSRIAERQVPLGPLTAEELERIVRRPAERARLHFESDLLVEDLLRDAGVGKGNLALLEFCLQELYRVRDRATRTMTQEGYRKIGRVAGALGQRADRVLERLGPGRRETVRRLFTARLVHLADQAGNDTKRAARLDRLTAAEREVVESFVSEDRILVTDEASVEIAHERLLGGWDTLQEWLREDREMLLWRQRVAYPLAQSLVLPLGTLREAHGWRKKRPEAFSPAENRRINRGLVVLSAVGATVLAGVLWVAGIGALGAWRSTSRERLVARIEGAAPEELVSQLDPPLGLEAADVAKALHAAGRWEEAVAIEADFFEETDRYLEALEPRLAVLGHEERPYVRLGEVLWHLDYLTAKAAESDYREVALGLGSELRAHLRAAVKRRPFTSPPARGVFRLIVPKTRELACGPGDPVEASFCMGSVRGAFNEQPVHPVKLQPYCLATHEVTEAEYGRFDPAMGGNTQLPVASVSWSEAYAYAAWLGGRLPTEAEWEYAARAGTIEDTWWFFGNDESLLKKHAWYLGRDYGGGPAVAQPVEGLERSPLGLYDMYGNVSEWVADRYDDYSAEPETTPAWGPASSLHGRRVFRGGSFAYGAFFARSAFRDGGGPGLRSNFLGFRVVLPAPCRDSKLDPGS